MDVKKSADALKKMLQISKGDRTVPVIVENGSITIGYGGGG